MQEISFSQSATPEQLIEQARAGTISREALEEGLNFIAFQPSAKEWRHFLQICLLTLGAGLLVAGIFFFFAYNWADLHRFAKLGLVQGAILLAAGLAHYLGMDSLAGKISLSAAALLVGALLALFGQIYQSTADAYTLFLYWAIYIVGWVIIGRFAPLWLILLGLLNLALLLFWDQSSLPYERRFEEESLFLLNGAALIAWEWFQQQGTRWMQVRWWPRIVAAAAFLAISIPTIGTIWGERNSELVTQQWIAPLLYLIFVIAFYVYYRYQQFDLFNLTIMALSLISIVTAGIARVLEFDETIMFLVTGVAVIVQASLAVIWLRHLDTGELSSSEGSESE